MSKSLCRHFKNALNVLVLEAAAATFCRVCGNIRSLPLFYFEGSAGYKDFATVCRSLRQSAFMEILMLVYKIPRKDKFLVTCKNWCFVNLWAT
jgi:hypothetical protein